jgi:hypothetical protein
LMESRYLPVVTSEALPPAVILGLADTGYGIVRSLSGKGIPMLWTCWSGWA